MLKREQITANLTTFALIYTSYTLYDDIIVSRRNPHPFMRKVQIVILFLSIWFCSSLFGQNMEPIKLANPSFEDFPRHSQPPIGWYDCGKPGETAPDTQPGSFQVRHTAKDGFTYLGMVTRDNETWEAVAQRLSAPLEAGMCYQFRIHLTYSDEYFSFSRTSEQNEFFIKPVKLRIWGGNSYCDKRELLSESELVKNTNWKEFQFHFKPKRDYKFILFEAFYKTPTLFPYNGNLLVDDASAIVPTGKCDEWDEEIMDDEPEIIASDENVNVKPKPVKPKPSETKPDETKPDENIVVIPPPPKKEPKIMKDLVIEKVEEGQSLRIENLNFDTDTFNIKDDMHPVLDEIYSFLKNHNNVSVEIGGHTNGLPSDEYCYWLSDRRADAVTKYLIEKGIPEDRISHKGYGKTQPIATNSTLAGRKKNQRVEIKILSLGG